MESAAPTAVAQRLTQGRSEEPGLDVRMLVRALTLGAGAEGDVPGRQQTVHAQGRCLLRFEGAVLAHRLPASVDEQHQVARLPVLKTRHQPLQRQSGPLQLVTHRVGQHQVLVAVLIRVIAMAAEEEEQGVDPPGAVAVTASPQLAEHVGVPRFGCFRRELVGQQHQVVLCDAARVAQGAGNRDGVRPAEAQAWDRVGVVSTSDDEGDVHR